MLWLINGAKLLDKPNHLISSLTGAFGGIN